MSYSIRGNSCTPKTIACSSAHKYLPPSDPIYKQWGMYMYRFPGGDVQQTLETDPVGNPNIIQTYYGKIYDYENINPVSSGKIGNTYQSRRNQGCKNC
jgi:hypothetical protein